MRLGFGSRTSNGLGKILGIYSAWHKYNSHVWLKTCDLDAWAWA